MELLQNMESKLKQNYKVWKYLEQINAYFQNNILEIGCIVCIDHDIFQKKIAMLLEMETKVFMNCYAVKTKL